MKEVKQPKYNIGDKVIVFVESDKQKIAQGIITFAECFYDEGRQGEWFYRIEIPTSNGVSEPEIIYSYEINTGNAKTKIIN